MCTDLYIVTFLLKSAQHAYGGPLYKLPSVSVDETSEVNILVRSELFISLPLILEKNCIV